MLKTGERAGITPPAWDGAKPVSVPAEGLAYDWSPMARPDANNAFAWADELTSAKALVASARTQMATGGIDDYDFPPPARVQEVPQPMRDALDGVRKTVFPKRGDLGDPKQEVPNYLPDGTIHPDDAASQRLWDKPSVRLHLENVLFRLPQEHTRSMNVAAVDDALRAADDFSYAITYQVKGSDAKDVPDAKQAHALLTRIDTLLDETLQNRGTETIDAGWRARIGNRFQQLPVAGQRAAIAGAMLAGAAVAAGAGAIISNEMGD